MRRRGRAGADPGLRVCLFVCLLVRTGFGGWSGSEFRGKDRTKRFRRARSTKSGREVGSDSLNLATSLVGILGKARKQAGWARANPVPGDFGCLFGYTITVFATPDGLTPVGEFF